MKTRTHHVKTTTTKKKNGALIMLFSLILGIITTMQVADSFHINSSPPTTTATKATSTSSSRTALASTFEVPEEKKDDDEVLYWESSLSSDTAIELPSFPKRPRMIVFDKDGTLGNDAASLQRWTNHMTNCFAEALQQEQEHLCKTDQQIQQDVRTFHDAIGWDASTNHVIPSAPLAAGTWEEAVETCATVFAQCGLPSADVLAAQWHASLKNVHGADPPVIPNLATLIRSCRDDFDLKVAVCTSDDRKPTDNSLRNWEITELIDYTICGDEVMEAKPSAFPLRLLCEKACLTPEECIVVGDTTGDTGMARNAQAGLCIGVLSGSGTADQLMETGANIILPNVGEIPALLKTMGVMAFTGGKKQDEVPALVDLYGIMNIPC